MYIFYFIFDLNTITILQINIFRIYNTKFNLCRLQVNTILQEFNSQSRFFLILNPQKNNIFD